MSIKSKALQWAMLAVVVGGLSVSCGLEVPESSDGSQGGSDNGAGSEPTTEPAPDGAGGSGESNQARVDGPSWSEYMLVRDGRVCTYSSTDEGMDVTDETVLTREYADVREESDGTHFTLESTTEIATSPEEQHGEAEWSETESLGYVLGADGLLRAEPQVFNRGDLEANADGFVVYPSIKEVREGKSASSSTTLSVRSSDPATQAELEESLESGESEMETRLDYKVTGLPPEEISTPAGTFTDVVGVSIKIEGIEILNANEETRREMDEMSQVLTELAGTPIVWFARDVGIVQTETEGGMMEDMSSAMKLVGCDGEQTGDSGDSDTGWNTDSSTGNGDSGTEGSSGHSSGNSSTDQQASFELNYTGQITQTDEGGDVTSEYGVEANLMPVSETTIENMVGEVIGEVRYEDLDCSGVWVIEEVNEESIVVEEQTEDSVGPDGCIETVSVTLTPQEDGTLQYYAESESIIAEGILSRGESSASESPAPEDDIEKASLSQAVGDYYRAVGVEEWEYTYNHLDSHTQSMFTEEEWSRKNQWFWDRNPTVYDILSIESDGNSEGNVAEVELRITPEEGSSWTRTTYFVQEDGEWKHRFSEAETDLFMPDATYEEFVEAQAGTS